MKKREGCLAAWGLFFISAGGLLLHVRIHPTRVDAFNWVPIIIGLVTMLAVPLMFCGRKTAPWAYLINVASVVVGLITMTHFSIEHWSKDMPVTLWNVLVNTTLADNLILLAKIPLGQLALKAIRAADQAPKPASGGCQA